MIRINIPVEQIVNHLRIAEIPHIVLIPIGDMKDYWDYAINYGYTIGETNYLPCRLDSNLLDINNINNITLRNVFPSVYEDNDFIVFEFPDEETALYFKLKFCS